MPRRSSVSHAFSWFHFHGYLDLVQGEDGYVVIGTDRIDRKYVLTDKGRAPVRNLDAGHDIHNPDTPTMITTPTHTEGNDTP